MGSGRVTVRDMDIPARADWFCANCLRPVTLNRHMRCENCDSDAVDSMEKVTPSGRGNAARL